MNFQNKHIPKGCETARAVDYKAGGPRQCTDRPVLERLFSGRKLIGNTFGNQLISQKLAGFTFVNMTIGRVSLSHVFVN